MPGGNAAANWSGVDQTLCVSDVYVCQIFGKLVEQADDVGSDNTPSQRDDKTSADLRLSTLVGSQPVSECLQHVKRHCDFGIHAQENNHKDTKTQTQYLFLCPRAFLV
jgi:hypothetical protein